MSSGNLTATAAEPAPPRRTPRRRLTRRHAGIAAIVLVALSYATVIQAIGWNQTSHYALVRALDHGTAHIDPYQSTTGDKAFYRGHWYSARAPGLAFFNLPAYKVLRAAGATSHPRVWINRRHNDEMIWLVGLWGAVLPGLLTLLLIRYLGERLERGFGTAAAVTAGLGTLILPFSTLLFSHVLSMLLAFASFVLLWREFERPAPPRLAAIAVAGLLIGYGLTTEYPILFAGIVLGCYAGLGGAGARVPLRVATRALTFAGGVAVGLVPLALYDKWAYGSFTHIAYADIPKQHAGFFGIRVPNPAVAIEILFSSRGLLTLAPVLIMGIVGIALLYRRGRRAEATVITAVTLLYLAYNSGYYLPYGGTVPGPRFMITVLPFLSVPIALSFRRFPGPTLALAGFSAAGMIIPTLTKPMVSAEGDTGIWTKLLGGGQFQATVAGLAGVRNQWLALIPFLVPAAAAAALATWVTTRLRISGRSALAGAACAGGWALFAAFGPALFGIDHGAGERIVAAGDPKGVLLKYGSHPIEGLALIGLGAAIVALLIGVAVRGSRRAAEPTAAVAAASG